LQDFPAPTANPSRGDKHMPTKSRNRVKEPHAQDPQKQVSGRWQARLTYYDTDTGKRHETTTTFDTEREAKKWSREQEIRYGEDTNLTTAGSPLRKSF